MNNLDYNTNIPKQRHGCVTTWLILSIVINLLLSIFYIFGGDFIVQNFNGQISKSILILLSLLGIVSVIFLILILKWKKIGFWGLAVITIIVFIVNIITGTDIYQSIKGAIGIVILYAILQIRKDGVSAWDNLE